MSPDLLELLCCPACHGPLRWAIEIETAAHIEEAQAWCQDCGRRYEVREGIAVLIAPGDEQRDLWAEVDSSLDAWLTAHPQVEQALLEGSESALSPTDLFLRGQLLEQRGAPVRGRQLQAQAELALYSGEYLAARQAQISHVVEACQAGEGPIVDLASGLGALVEALLRGTARPVVATDLSPLALQRDRAYFRPLGYDARVSYLACDARRLPFCDGALGQMTTYLGLANIEQPAQLLQALRRAVSGELLAVHHFFRPQDDENAALIGEFGLETLLFEERLLAALAEAGWQAHISQRTPARAVPTPASALIPELRLDGLPVKETTVDWCVLVAS